MGAQYWVGIIDDLIVYHEDTTRALQDGDGGVVGFKGSRENVGLAKRGTPAGISTETLSSKENLEPFSYQQYGKARLERLLVSL